MAVEWENGIPILTGESLLSDVPEYTQALAAANITPVGAIMPYMGETAPDYWLLCDGKSYDAAYFNVLSGVSANFHDDGTFRVPDLRGRSPVGTASGFGGHLDSTVSPVCDIDLGTRLGDWRMQNHSHYLTTSLDGAGGYWGVTGQTSPGMPYPGHEPTTLGTGLAGAAVHRGQGYNFQPSTGVNFIVYTGKPTLDENGDILAECGQGAEIAAMTTRMMIEQRLAEAGIGEEEVKMLKEQLATLKESHAK